MLMTILLTVTAALAEAPPANDAGEVAFANSGAPAAQPPFLRGLALLHDFEYPAAAEAFRKAEELDPQFAMAYWGEAMTYTHPVWFQQDADAARAALGKLGATREERLAKAKTPRERDYLAAVETLYGDGTKEQRDFLYADAMAVVHERYPDDVDATAFYALALLGTSHEGRDFATYMRAAALLEEVFPSHQRHPGVLHYLIHSYDDPIHAPLGIRAARLYGNVAPSASHALHMTSHIFIALGMWDDVIDANRRAIDVANRQRAERSKPPLVCGHYPTWLHYALLQEHRFDEARRMFAACRASVLANAPSGGPMDTPQGRMESYAEMRAQQVTSGGRLSEADRVTIPAGANYADARFALAYGDVLDAALRRDAAALKEAAARVHALQGEVMAAVHEHMTASDHTRTQVIADQADALLLIANGKRAEAIPLLENAVKGEHSMPFDFGPPVVPKPSDELLGETLMAAGRPADAEKAYQSALDRAPGRTTALEGLLRAQKAAGHADQALLTAAKLARYLAK